MRRFLLAGLLALLSWGMAAQDYKALDEKMDAYFEAIQAASIEEKCDEAKFLITSATDPTLQSHIAQYIFSHYSASAVMGDENVAVYTAREWIIPGKVAVSEADLSAAKSYVRFTGRSLIGMKAPLLTLRDINAQTVTLFDQPGERYTVLFFYDTTCAPCALETEYLKRYLPSAPIPLDVVAVYVGIREPSWARYRVTGLTLEGVRHLWDPGMQSDFQEAYGVVKTPALFLIAPDRTIVGRRLDTKSLTALLESLVAREKEEEAPYVYGSEESLAVFDGFFSNGATARDVLETAAYIEKRTLGEDNPSGYTRSIGDLLYYLSFRRSEAFCEALTPFIDQYVYGKDVWSASDSVQVLTLANLMKGLLSKCPVGSSVPDVTVTGTLRRPGKADRQKTVRLGKLRGQPGIVVFASDSCQACTDVRPALDRMLSSGPKKMKVLVTDADPSLLDDFDLSSLPYVLFLDKKGIITRRYVDL